MSIYLSINVTFVCVWVLEICFSCMHGADISHVSLLLTSNLRRKDDCSNSLLRNSCFTQLKIELWITQLFWMLQEHNQSHQSTRMWMDFFAYRLLFLTYIFKHTHNSKMTATVFSFFSSYVCQKFLIGSSKFDCTCDCCAQLCRRFNVVVFFLSLCSWLNTICCSRYFIPAAMHNAFPFYSPSPSLLKETSKNMSV